MPDYTAMYKKLFQSQAQAIRILQEAQQDTEEMYISSPELEIRVLDANELKSYDKKNQDKSM